jgi:ATP-dependent Lhr-like helicase
MICSKAIKQVDIRVQFPEATLGPEDHESFWEPYVDAFKQIIERNRSTLLFANSRRLCERLTLQINTGEEGPIAYAHHGSLSREIREVVEQKLKLGELRAIVATNSLEMGIDIGALDEVVLIQSPPSVSSAIQRIGRAGHQVGEISRGTLFPTHAMDLLEAASLAPAILSQDIESVKPVECPLDVLAQIIVSMVAVEMWDIETLYRQLKTSYPFRNLGRAQFDLVLTMLAGRYADSRIRELHPRVSIDRLDHTVVARTGAQQALFISGGTIPDRGYFHLRHHETNARIGELDEEFVWEASVGQTFALGSQHWRIERITHNEVFVLPGHHPSMATPFWRGEENNRDFHFSVRIACFLEAANGRLDDQDFATCLERDHFMDQRAAEDLITFLKRQKEATQSDLPHRHHLLVETVNSGPGGTPGNQVVLHTLWGGRVNRPFALALDAAWENRFGYRLEVYAGNDSVILVLPHEVSGDELLSLMTSATVEPLLRKRLEGSGFFGARFRECAGRSLLLARSKFNERMPLWMSRLRSQKLLDAVLQYDDFPILLETWRTCLQDEFDMESLRQVIMELESGSIQWSEARTSHPSPMAQAASWRQLDRYVYMGDEPASAKTSRLRRDLLRDFVFSPGIRPTVSRELVHRFERKRKRLSPGYSPSTPRDLMDWVKERLIIPMSEWECLLKAIQEDHRAEPEAFLEPLTGKLVWIRPARASEPLIAALEILPRMIHALFDESDKVHIEPFPSGGLDPMTQGKAVSRSENRDEVLTSLLGEWLQYYGPTTMAFVERTLGMEGQRLLQALEDLVDSQKLITGQLVNNESDDAICDGENFEILLRLSRAEAAPSFEPMTLDRLLVFLAAYQGIVDPKGDIEGLFPRIEQLLCYGLPAGLWESEIFPARLRPYETAWLDTIMQEGDLRWIGCENGRVAFCFESDLDLMQEEGNTSRNDLGADSAYPDRFGKSGPGDRGLAHLFPDSTGRYDFSGLLQRSQLQTDELVDRIWHAVWQGQVTNDTFLSLRRGIENRFRLPDRRGRYLRSRRRSRRSSGRETLSQRDEPVYVPGSWFRLSIPELSDDRLEMEERNKDRVRLLLDRYGILFRELLARELPPFRWSNLFRSLRLMELSGEVLAGCFFHGIPGPQFISHEAFRLLQRNLPEDRVYWFNAADPASLCGIPLEGIRGMLPKRSDTTHLVFRGKRLVLISKRNGKSLTFHVPPDDPELQTYLGMLRYLLTRRFQPVRRITIETINDEEATRSPYLDALRNGFEVMIDYKQVILYRKVSWLL